MAKPSVHSLALLALAAVVFATATATAARELSSRASEVQKTVFCKMTQAGLDACKPAIMGPKPEPKPADECCTALKAADLNCLCSYKNSGWLALLNIDPNLAMQLPSKCDITPPATC